MYIPISITVALIFIGLVVSGYISSLSDLSLHNRIGTIIQTWACVAASISASFVIHSYVLTNRSFIDSRRPALLLQVVGGFPTTQVHYENRSVNPFRDLTIKMKLNANGTIIDLSDLFSSKMYVAPWDARDRRFDTKQEFFKHGINIDAATIANERIILSLEYEYMFNGRIEIVKVQSYALGNNGWSII